MSNPYKKLRNNHSNKTKTRTNNNTNTNLKQKYDACMKINQRLNLERKMQEEGHRRIRNDHPKLMSMVHNQQILLKDKEKEITRLKNQYVLKFGNSLMKPGKVIRGKSSKKRGKSSKKRGGHTNVDGYKYPDALTGSTSDFSGTEMLIDTESDAFKKLSKADQDKLLSGP